jgi:hypothetical protein
MGQQMNHARFALGLLDCLNTPSLEESMKVVFYLYGELLQVCKKDLCVLIHMRDKSKLLLQEEYLTEEQLQYISHGMVQFSEWTSDGLPWDERGYEFRQRSDGTASTDCD